MQITKTKHALCPTQPLCAAMLFSLSPAAVNKSASLKHSTTPTYTLQSAPYDEKDTERDMAPAQRETQLRRAQVTSWTAVKNGNWLSSFFDVHFNGKGFLSLFLPLLGEMVAGARGQGKLLAGNRKFSETSGSWLVNCQNHTPKFWLNIY